MNSWKVLIHRTYIPQIMPQRPHQSLYRNLLSEQSLSTGKKPVNMA